MLDLPRSLHELLQRPCWQMLDPPRSLQSILLRWCWQMLDPQHSLHWLLWRPCWQMLDPTHSLHEWTAFQERVMTPRRLSFLCLQPVCCVQLLLSVSVFSNGQGLLLSDAYFGGNNHTHSGFTLRNARWTMKSDSDKLRSRMASHKCLCCSTTGHCPRECASICKLCLYYGFCFWAPSRADKGSPSFGSCSSCKNRLVPRTDSCPAHGSAKMALF